MRFENLLTILHYIGNQHEDDEGNVHDQGDSCILTCVLYCTLDGDFHNMFMICDKLYQYRVV